MYVSFIVATWCLTPICAGSASKAFDKLWYVFIHSLAWWYRSSSMFWQLELQCEKVTWNPWYLTFTDTPYHLILISWRCWNHDIYPEKWFVCFPGIVLHISGGVSRFNLATAFRTQLLGGNSWETFLRFVNVDIEAYHTGQW